MRVYRVSDYDDDNGFSFTWHRNKTEAEKTARDLVRREVANAAEGGYSHADAIEVRDFDVPTTKAGLVWFLNIHATSVGST